MKLGSLILMLSAMVAILAVRLIERPVWFVLLTWLSVNGCAISASYFFRSPWLFGKLGNGTRHWASQLFLLPYTIAMTWVWWIIVCLSREPKYNSLQLDFPSIEAEELLLSRRLLAGEVPVGVDAIIDLTCEFVEPALIRNHAAYVCHPILDASTPSVDELLEWVEQASRLAGCILIHCAQGHGRTGLFAAAILLKGDSKMSPAEALIQLQRVRPELSCNSMQQNCLVELRRRLSGELDE